MSKWLRCENITKNLGKYRISNIDFSLEPGTVLGLIGVNGCGKTSLLRVLLGSYSIDPVRGDNGEITLSGMHFTEDVKAFRRKMAFVMQECPFPWGMTPEEIGEVYGPYYDGFDLTAYCGRLREYGVPEGRKIENLSKGQQIRVQLAFAESHEAVLYVMDEPVGSLDPDFRDIFYDKIRKIAATERASVILSSHLVTELEGVADRILWMKRGECEGTVRYFGGIDELREQYRMISGEREMIEALPEDLVVGKRIRENHCEALLRMPSGSRQTTEGVLAQCRYADLQEIMYYQEKSEDGAVRK